MKIIEPANRHLLHKEYEFTRHIKLTQLKMFNRFTNRDYPITESNLKLKNVQVHYIDCHSSLSNNLVETVQPEATGL